MPATQITSTKSMYYIPDTQRIVNQKSLQLLNNLFGAIEDFILKQERDGFDRLDSPLVLPFVYRLNSGKFRMIHVAEHP